MYACYARDIPFCFLTNNSQRTLRDVVAKLFRMGVEIEEQHIITCAMATARFLAGQTPNGTAFVIGEEGLLTAFHQNGYAVVDHDPEYVVVGEEQATAHEVNIASATDELLSGFLSEPKADAKLKQVLQEILSRRQAFSKIEAEANAVTAAIRQIDIEQKRIRENLDKIDPKSVLAVRYLKKLTELEDQLEKLNSEAGAKERQ